MTFYPGSGFVKFVFGNMDDRYYTAQNIRVDIYRYLCCRLREEGLSYFYVYEGEESGNCRMRPLNAKSDEIYKNQFVKKTLFSRKMDDQENAQSYADLLGSAEKIFELMKKEQGCGVMIPYPLFLELLKDQQAFKFIRKHHKGGGRNLMLVLAPASAAKAKGILQMELLTECELLSERIKEILEEDYCFPFEEWKEDLGDQMIFLNELSYDSIFSLVQNYFMKHFSCLEPIFGEMKWYAGIIWAWHHIDSFYFRYPDLMKEQENPCRRYSVIEQQLGNREFRRYISSILSELKERENEEPVAYLTGLFGAPADRRGVYLYNDENPKRWRAIHEICRMYHEESGVLPESLAELRLIAGRYRQCREPNPMAEDYVNQYITLERSRLLQLQKHHYPVTDEPIELFCDAVKYYYARTDLRIDPLDEQTKFMIAQERFVLYFHSLRLSAYLRDVRFKREMLSAAGDTSREYRCEQLLHQTEELLNLRAEEYTDLVYNNMKKLSAEINNEIY